MSKVYLSQPTIVSSITLTTTSGELDEVNLARNYAGKPITFVACPTSVKMLIITLSYYLGSSTTVPYTKESAVVNPTDVIGKSGSNCYRVLIGEGIINNYPTNTEIAIGMAFGSDSSRRIQAYGVSRSGLGYPYSSGVEPMASGAHNVILTISMLM